ncbi:MAG: hypothetical protein CMP21_03595 [Rickettsiales bacterium]|nr:hypothetical protein [Rickettsiales bacterium]
MSGLIGKKLEKKSTSVNFLKMIRLIEMEERSIKKYISEIFAQDIDVSISLEKDLIKKAKNMEKFGLSSTQEYKMLIKMKTEHSYFTAYLYRLFDLLIVKNPSLIENINPSNIGIKRMINVWKKTDINNIRKMRKDIGDGGVKLMKVSVDNSISKLNVYIEALGTRIKDL